MFKIDHVNKLMVLNKSYLDMKTFQLLLCDLPRRFQPSRSPSAAVLPSGDLWSEYLCSGKLRTF